MQKAMRTFSAEEVEELVNLLINDPNILPERYAGMVDIVRMLKHFATMTDAEIEAETLVIYRSIL